ncbi:MAG: tetratricopeptide repeat protein [Pseudomonadota bacterium]
MKSTLCAFALSTFMLATPVLAADLEAVDELLTAERYDDAIALLRTDSKQADAQAKLAEVYMQMNDASEAEKWIKRVVDDAPDDAAVQFLYGSVMGARAQSSVIKAFSYAKKSRSGFTRAVELAPDNVDYLKMLIDFHLYVPSIAGGERDEVQVRLPVLRELDPVEAALVDAKILWKDDKDSEADAVLAATLEQYPDDSRVLLMAGFRKRQKDDLEAAYAYFESAAQDGSDNLLVDNARLAALYQMGRVADKLGSHEQAGIAALEQFLDEAYYHRDVPSRDWARYRLANLLKATGESARAGQLYAQLENTNDESLKEELDEL